MKAYIAILLFVSANYLGSCSGPRNIFSSSPLVSPVLMKKGSVAIDANYFSHTQNAQTVDSFTSGKDNGFSLTVSHMLKEKILLFANVDVMKEKNEFRDSIGLPNDPSFPAYDAGFDSSIVYAKRYSLGTAVEFFMTERKKRISSLSFSLSFRKMNMNEAGLLNQSSYHRFYQVSQISFCTQYNFLFKIAKAWELAWVSRLTFVNSFNTETDYLPDEKLKAGLHDNGLTALLCLTGAYVQFKPIQELPIYLNAQVFNDMALWNQPLAKYELGRRYVKGTGVAVGMRYVFFQ